MKRRAFLRASLATTVAGTSALSATSSPAQSAKTDRELYELRTYTLKVAKQPLLDDYLSKAFIPALGRLGVGPVGVMSEKLGPERAAVYVLIVFRSPDQAATLSARLAADAEHQKAGAEYLAAPAADPVYERIESSLMMAISGMPRLEKPDASKPRLFNLRIYESHNERAAAKKIEMFNTGELAIFRRVGLKPVFFGEAILGARMPNLTYMLVFDDDEARKQAWGRFGGDKDWQKLRAAPGFADKEIVSKITNKLLTPAACSQI